MRIDWELEKTYSFLVQSKAVGVLLLWIMFIVLFVLKYVLKLIYHSTSKGKKFILAEERQNPFEKIKRTLQKPYVLHLPDNKGKFHLYSGNSRFATGGALHQMQKR